jgi:hypothetical protein
MKTSRLQSLRVLLVAALGFLGATPRHASAADATALQLVQEGNRYVGEQSKNKVLEITSERSFGGLAPNIWRICYYDPDTRFKVVEVKFGAGAKLDVKRPMRVFERGAEERVLDLPSLQVDSDRAIQLATADPLLQKLTVKATQLSLEKEKHDAQPVWKVGIWAAKLAKPDKLAKVGEVLVSATDGKIVKSDLHLNKVD